MTEESIATLKRVQLAISLAYRRNPDQRWSYCEESLLSEIVRDRPDAESELAELLAFKTKVGRYFPQKVERLLSEWTGSLDRARQPKEHYETTQQHRPGSVNANKGTANEGRSAGYSAAARRKLEEKNREI